MRMIVSIWVATAMILPCGCSQSAGTSNGHQDQNVMSVGETPPSPETQMYPILKYSRNQGSEVLLQHQATEAEKELFKKMDAAVVALGDDTELDACYEVVVPIGQHAGLSDEESIAFWTRMTFSEFEP